MGYVMHILRYKDDSITLEGNKIIGYKVDCCKNRDGSLVWPIWLHNMAIGTLKSTFTLNSRSSNS